MKRRDRRALLALASAVLLALALWRKDPRESPAASPILAIGGQPIATLESQLDRSRRTGIPIRSREVALSMSHRELDNAEQFLLSSTSPALARAEMHSILLGLADQHGIVLDNSHFDPIESSQVEYTAVPITVFATCSIDQIVALLDSIARSNKLLATRLIELRLASSSNKALRARITVAGYLLPDDASKP
jgi:hypothetical protein